MGENIIFMQISAKNKASRNCVLYYVKEKEETARAVYSQARHKKFKLPATQAKDMHIFLCSFNSFTLISGTLLL